MFAKAFTVILPFFFAEDSNGCQNIVKLDILMLLESETRRCQFTERRPWLPATFEGLSVWHHFPSSSDCIISILMQSRWIRQSECTDPAYAWLYLCFYTCTPTVWKIAQTYEVLLHWFNLVQNYNKVTHCMLLGTSLCFPSQKEIFHLRKKHRRKCGTNAASSDSLLPSSCVPVKAHLYYFHPFPIHPSQTLSTLLHYLCPSSILSTSSRWQCGAPKLLASTNDDSWEGYLIFID